MCTCEVYGGKKLYIIRFRHLGVYFGMKYFTMELLDKIIILTMLSVQICCGIRWDKIRCSYDREPVQEGILPRELFGRFPWIGVIQYDFFLSGKMRYAITAAVRIHPWYALASAEDIVKIDRKTITNTTHFVLWHSAEVKYYMGVLDYILHHEYLSITYATVAMVVLMPDRPNRLGHAGPALPVCLPIKGYGTYKNLYVVKISDSTGQLTKEVVKMQYIDKGDCNAFYEKAELDYKMMVPTHLFCATAVAHLPACVWDGGSLLVSRESELFWTLLGFGVRGPGCGAPARFIDINSEMEWIDTQIAAASYYQCEECLHQCCNNVHGPPAKLVQTDRLKDNKKLLFI